MDDKLKLPTDEIKERDDYQARNELRALAINSVTRHEQESHEGQPCWDERCNLIAWICHSLGIHTMEHFTDIVELTKEYQKHHIETTMELSSLKGVTSNPK